MASIFLGVIVLCLFLGTSCGVEVQWSISLPSECVANDTLSGVCTRSRTVQCVKTQSGQHIPNYYCNGVSKKPSHLIKCDTQKCPGRCVVSMWSPWEPCDVACSRLFTYRTRDILWRDNDAVACPPLVEKALCMQCAHNSNEFYLWRVGEWGTCRAFGTVAVYDVTANKSQATASGSDVCGRYLKLGKATRKVKCIDANGVEQKARKCLNSKDKDGRITQRPDRGKVCQFPCDCHVSAWSAWSGCPGDCSRTEERRTRGVLYPPQLGGKPCGNLVEKRACNTRDCPHYTWYTSSWGACKSEGVLNGSACGNGFKERVVFCIESSAKKKAGEVQPLDEHLCDVATKPVARQLCQTVCPLNCVVSDWKAWEPCSTSCGAPGVKRRVRNVVQMAKNGGAECPSLVQMSPCEVMPCHRWVIQQWSHCIATGCGKGMNMRTVYCVTTFKTWASNTKCSAVVPQPATTKDCIVPCPSDCALSDWAKWGACSKSCGVQGGVQTRRRSIIAYPSSIRPVCPSADKLIDTQKCNVGKLCESESAYTWKFTAWGPCDLPVNGTCGPAKGVQRREVNCGSDMRNFLNDTLCVNMSKPAAQRQCDVPCPVDCVITKWGNWSECNATCQNQGTQISKRYVLQNAQRGGSPCPPEMSNGVEVKLRSCWSNQPCYNYTWTVTPWQECRLLPQLKTNPPSCGSGYQTRNVSCVRSDGKLVETSYCFESSLETAPKTLKECWKPCDDYCVRTSWSEWSKCPNKCTKALPVRDRSRQVVNLSPARGGFSTTCPQLTALDFTETEDCPKIPCRSYKWYSASIGGCIPDNSVTSCGQGGKERHVLCQDQSDLSFVAESLCDASNKPSPRENCFVQCTQDCVESAWGEWDHKCSNSCGDSLKTRNRTVLIQPVGLGRACGSLVDKQLCMHEPACTSFQWSVGIWSTCKLGPMDSVCGNGTQTRDVICSPDTAREWICLKQAPKPDTVQNCSLACPGDCVLGNWSPWVGCVRGMHGCIRNRWRKVLRYAHMTSKLKCSSYSVEDKMNCTCQSTGKIVTSDWSTCLVNQALGPDCGKGMQYRSVKCEGDDGVIVDPQHCPKFASTSQSRDCEIPCRIDCVMGGWGEWSSCTSACGLDGKIQRSRKVVKAEQNGGRKCPEGMQYRPCNGIPCYTYSLVHGAWSKCYVDGQGCGYGSQTRETMCRRNDGEIVNLHFCFGLLKKSSDITAKLKVLQDVINNSSELTVTSSRSCDVSCPGDCFMSEWSAWSECGKNCFENSTKYEQSRSRVKISDPDAGGKACSSKNLETQTCQASTGASQCIGARWRTGAWQGNGTRAVWCETSSGIRVTGACAAQNKPSDTKSCSPKCTDPNSICHEARCICQPNYELFQRQCIPTRGCLRDGHCIREHTMCKNEKCTCKTNYMWNSTVGSCVPGQIYLPRMSSKPSESTTKTSTRRMTTKTTAEPTRRSSTEEEDISTEEEEDTSTKEEDTLIEDTLIKEQRASTTENSVKKAIEKEETISPGFWKWIGIGVGAIVFLLILAIGFYCHTKRQRKAKHRMMKLKRNTIELVGVMTYADEYKSKPERV